MKAPQANKNMRKYNFERRNELFKKIGELIKQQLDQSPDENILELQNFYNSVKAKTASEIAAGIGISADSFPKELEILTKITSMVTQIYGTNLESVIKGYSDLIENEAMSSKDSELKQKLNSREILAKSVQAQFPAINQTTKPTSSIREKLSFSAYALLNFEQEFPNLFATKYKDVTEKILRSIELNTPETTDYFPALIELTEDPDFNPDHERLTNKVKSILEVIKKWPSTPEAEKVSSLLSNWIERKITKNHSNDLQELFTTQLADLKKTCEDFKSKTPLEEAEEVVDLADVNFDFQNDIISKLQESLSEINQKLSEIAAQESFGKKKELLEMMSSSESSNIIDIKKSLESIKESLEELSLGLLLEKIKLQSEELHQYQVPNPAPTSANPAIQIASPSTDKSHKR